MGMAATGLDLVYRIMAGRAGLRTCIAVFGWSVKKAQEDDDNQICGCV
jgi:hypothetical protein